MDNQHSELDSLFEFFGTLDRSLFLEKEYLHLAALDRPLPIGHGQTISQPTLVLQMTKLLNLDKDHKVLEIGTGSGYQTAFLAEFAQKVYTVEKISVLAEQAQQRLAKLGYRNIQFKTGDGSEGWPEYAPYDRIMVTASAAKLPQPLIEQLKPGGKMIIPVGERAVQELKLISKNPQGNMESHSLGEVLFVELKGEFGWGNK